MDRRISPRVEWHGPVHYRKGDEEKFRMGFLANISTTGAMLWLPDPVQIGDELNVVIISEYDQVPVHMQVVRKVKESRYGYHGFGCVLETHESWEKQ